VKSWRALALLLVVVGLLAAPLASAAPASRPTAALSDSLVAYWQVDEASGTRADELTGCGGGGCDLLLEADPIGSAAGILGSAAEFVGFESNWLGVGADMADLSMGDIDFTLSAWAYTPSCGGACNGTVLGKYEVASGGREYVILIESGALFFIVSGNGTATTAVSAGAWSDSTWHHIVAWHDPTANTINIQLDNGTPASAAHSTGVLDGTREFMLGSLNGLGGYGLTGRVDEVGVWKRLLSSDERTALYNAGAGCTYPFTDCEDAEPTSTPTVTNTPPPTDTPTPGPSATPTNTPPPTATSAASATPPYLSAFAMTASGGEMWLERRFTLGDLAVFLVILVKLALDIMRWMYELTTRGGG
jgi:hypothetical protein